MLPLNFGGNSKRKRDMPKLEGKGSVASLLDRWIILDADILTLS